jgi:hypothetical protein
MRCHLPQASADSPLPKVRFGDVRQFSFTFFQNQGVISPQKAAKFNFQGNENLVWRALLRGEKIPSFSADTNEKHKSRKQKMNFIQTG